MGIFLLIVLVLVVWFVLIYNKLRALSEVAKGARSNILAATRKRLDLAKRISDVASAYAGHEKLTQITVSESMTNIADTQNANQKVNQVMGQVSALAVAYPELKANTTYEQLMNQWHDLENDIHANREHYNATATHYNAYQGALPQVLFAKTVGFGPAAYYHTETEGMDVIPEFVTDDGAVLKETMGRLANRSKQAAVKAKAAVQDMSVKNSPPDT